MAKTKLPTGMRTKYLKCKNCNKQGACYIFDKNLKDEDNPAGMWIMKCKFCTFIHLPSRAKLKICMRSALECKMMGL